MNERDEIKKLMRVANEHHRRLTDALVLLVDIYDRADCSMRMNEIRNWRYQLGPALEVPFPEAEEL